MGWMTDEVGMQCGNAHVKEPEDEETAPHDRQQLILILDEHVHEHGEGTCFKTGGNGCSCKDIPTVRFPERPRQVQDGG